MPLWGSTDAAANSVISAPALVNKAPTATNRDALFGNTTPSAFVSGVTVGQFGMDVTESKVARTTAQPRAAHAGWVVRKVGTGGRAGRVQYETLVAMGSLTADATDDAVLPDA